ncbi:MAG: enoyl-CoA hydratase/isomerase family protein [Chloroflexi bacterium]|nr:enoyl-CoA hydratase/isomerase family protein [Chloroflexota bacterium]
MPRFTGRPAAEFDFRDILYEKKNWVATVTINRPQVYNSYSTLALQEMTQAFHDAAWDDNVAVVVLTGTGERAFCTGGDVKEYATDYTQRPRDYWKWMGIYAECHQALLNIGKPTIARLNGMVVGGGNEFNMACDLAIAAEHVVIQQVGTRVGSVAAGGATQWLPIIVGDRRAREILYLCEPIPAQKALEWGLINQVVPSLMGEGGAPITDPQQKAEALKNLSRARIDLRPLDEAVAIMAHKLIDKFPECTRYTKQQVNFWKDMAWYQTIGHARDWLSVHFSSLEPYEGMTAFVEKRAAGYRELREKAAAGGSSEFLWGPYTQTCPQCGSKGIPQGFKYCGLCGASLVEGK